MVEAEKRQGEIMRDKCPEQKHQRGQLDCPLFTGHL
jgi:hypothetical protein